MRKLTIALTVFALLGLTTLAMAHGAGFGYGGHMYGLGTGGHMMDWYGTGTDTDASKFLNETAELRKEMHEKQFEYFEAVRKDDTDPEKVATLAKELDELRDKIHDQMPNRGVRGNGRGGYCW